VSARFVALESADFRRLWVSLLVSNVGTWMQNVAQSWVIYKMTGNDPIYLGLLGLSFALPMMTVPLLGGGVADKVNRVRLLLATQTAATLLALALAALAWSGALRPAHLLAATFLSALLLGFDNPARQALIPELVPKPALANALSLNAASFTGAALVGPAVAGALLGKIGAAWLFALNAASFLAVIFTLLTFRHREQARAAREARLADAVLGGLRYAASDRAAGGLLIIASIAALSARSYQQILPMFAAAVFHSGPQAYGALLTAGGAGALLGAAGLSARRSVESPMRVLRGSGFVLAVTLGLFTMAPTLPLAVAALVVAGCASTVFTTMIATKLQLEVPPALRGRVMGLHAITLIGLPFLGSLGLSAIARAMGAPRAVAIGAGVFAVALAVLRPPQHATPVAPPKDALP
jgi:hypothetical protein